MQRDDCLMKPVDRTEVDTRPIPRMPSRAGQVSAHLGRRVTRVRARSRLECELRAIAVDLLGPFESDELPAELAAWVGTATKTAVATVCDTSLSALTDALESQLAKASIDVVRGLNDAGIRHDAGIV